MKTHPGNMTLLRLPLFLSAAALWAAGGLFPARAADDIATHARRLVETVGPAIVSIQGVLSIEVGGISRSAGANKEQEINATATVIDAATGLMAASATAINPIGSMGEMTVNIGGTPQTITPKGTLHKLKMMLPDGTEIACRQVMEDRDLDLAFLLPVAEEGKPLPAFTAVDFSAGADAQLMDPVISIGRLGKLFDRQLAVGQSAVCAMVRKPRINYGLSGGFSGGLGTPVFTAQGVPLGLMIMRRESPTVTGGNVQANAIPVVLPCKDLMEIAAQAKEEAQKKTVDAPAENPTATP